MQSRHWPQLSAALLRSQSGDLIDGRAQVHDVDVMPENPFVNLPATMRLDPRRGTLQGRIAPPGLQAAALSEPKVHPSLHPNSVPPALEDDRVLCLTACVRAHYRSGPCCCRRAIRSDWCHSSWQLPSWSDRDAAIMPVSAGWLLIRH